MLRRKATLRHQNGLNDWLLYGEKQSHSLSKAADERAEGLEVITQNIAGQIQINTKCMVR